MSTPLFPLSFLSQRVRVRPQPALVSCLSISLLLLLAVTNVSAQSRATQFRQIEAEQARAQRLRAENPNLPYSIARGEAPAESSLVQSVKEKAQEALAAIFGPPTTPKWNQLAGPEAGRVFSLFEKNGRVFAGTNGGVYFSDDQGVTWQRSVNFPAQFTSFTTVSIGDALYVGTDGFSGGSGVYRSRDNGLTWEFLNNGLAETFGIRFLAVTHDNTLLAMAQGGGVFRSTDGGDSWSAVKNGLPDELGFFFMGSNARVTLAVTAQGLFRSADSGQSWQNINANLAAGVELNPGQFPLVSGNSFIVWAGTNGVLISDDDGVTWRKSNQGLPTEAFVGDVSRFGTDLYVSLADGSLYRSVNGGAEWRKQNDTYAFGKTIHATLKVEGALLTGTSDGIYRSTDDGQTWQRSVEGLRIGYIDGGILSVNNRLFVATKGGIWASDTRGATWRLLNNGIRQYPFVSVEGGGLGVKDGVLFAGSFGDGLYRSFDGGGSWERLSNGLPAAWFPSVIRVFNGKIYAGNWGGGAFVSADDGASWQAVKDLPTDDAIICMADLGAGRLLAGAYPGGIFRSDDDGQTWRAFSEGVRNDFINDFTVNSTSVIAATDDGIYHLNEDEAGWTENRYYTENAGGANAFIRQGKAIYASTFGRGVFVSYNNGATWGSFNQGMFTERGFYFTEIKGDLYFGSAGAGVWVLRATANTPPIIIPPGDESGDPSNDK
jgi:photosystem II stability/assembly factor-like uncharacterized protein